MAQEVESFSFPSDRVAAAVRSHRPPLIHTLLGSAPSRPGETAAVQVQEILLRSFFSFLR